MTHPNIVDKLIRSLGFGYDRKHNEVGYTDRWVFDAVFDDSIIRIILLGMGVQVEGWAHQCGADFCDSVDIKTITMKRDAHRVLVTQHVERHA